MSEKNKNEIYEELKGFFPEEYDLTPEELMGAEKCNVLKTDLVIEKKTPAAPIETKKIHTESHTPIINRHQEDVLTPEASETNDDVVEELEATVSKSQNTAKKRFHDLFDILEMFAICTACIIVIFSFFARLTIVEGDSMNDTLKSGEFLVISDFMYEPKQGDIVVVQDTSAAITELQKPLIKRIIAIGGQSVDITMNGTVTVTDAEGNTKIMEDSFIKQEAYEGKYFGHWDVPEGYIFVMGDNRNHSTDSRDMRLGIVDERCIVGKAFVRVLPASEFTVIENPLESN